MPGVTPDEICGVVISIRYSEDILGIWNKTADREVIGLLRDAIKKVLQLPPQASMEYKPHQTSIQDKSSFRNTQVRYAMFDYYFASFALKSHSHHPRSFYLISGLETQVGRRTGAIRFSQ